MPPKKLQAPLIPAPKITVLSDHAARDRSLGELDDSSVVHIADRDLLMLESRLASIFDILRHKNTRCPMAVAICGDWGTGKTSAMRWLETRLQRWNGQSHDQRGGHPRVHTIWFEPWRYHTREEVWRGIIAEVILQLFSVASLNEQNLIPRMAKAAKKAGGFLWRSVVNVAKNTNVELGAEILGVKVGVSGKALEKISEDYQSTARPHEAYLNQFEDTLRTWVGDFLKELGGPDESQPRMAIFIDDLDRCLPEVTLEVLESLKLYLNIDSLLFVAGLDREVVSAVVMKRYSDTGVPPAKAASYLDKIFQLEFTIPPSEAQMEGFLEEQIEALDTATDGEWKRALADCGCGDILLASLRLHSRNNPREIKRLLNSALIYGRNAHYDRALSKKGQTAADAALRFAQGIQLLLLQRLLADLIRKNSNLLIETRNLKWLEQCSQLLRGFLLPSGWNLETLAQELRTFKEPGITGTSSTPESAHQLGEEALKLSAELLAQLIYLYRHLTVSPPDRESQLWLHVPFLSLMQVEFSLAVAQRVPVIAPTAPSATPGTLPIADLPPYMRERLALSAEVLPDQLTPEHFAKVRTLDLSGIHLSAADLVKLPHLENLKHLNLTNCVRLERLPALPQLTALRLLGLNGCTDLRGPEALSGLTSLLGLQALSLSDCTGLTDTAALAGLSSLRELYLSHCTGLQGSAALAGLLELRDLKELWLDGCTGLTGTAALAGLRGLQELNLCRCTGLKGSAALDGLRELGNLVDLRLLGCTGLTEEDVEPLRQALGMNCQILGP